MIFLKEWLYDEMLHHNYHIKFTIKLPNVKIVEFVQTT